MSQRGREISYSPNVRVSSNDMHTSPDFVIKLLQANLFSHEKFDPALMTNEWREQFQEILTKNGVNIDIKKKFGVQLPKAMCINNKTDKKPQPDLKKMIPITNPKDINTVIDCKVYSQSLAPEALQKQFQEKLSAIKLEKKVKKEERKKEVMTKQKYMFEHYKRTYGTKLERNGQPEPDYMFMFKYKMPIDAKAKLEALKHWGLKPGIEDRKFNDIMKMIMA